MSRGVFVAVSAALLMAASSLPSPAQAGEWEYDPAADLILYDSVPVAQWYRHRPSIGTGPGYYYSHHPHHVPGYPQRLTGYPMPIYKAHRPIPAVRAYRVRPASHVDWCAARYRSYDIRSDTYQPYHGPRRYCRSPFW